MAYRIEATDGRNQILETVETIGRDFADREFDRLSKLPGMYAVGVYRDGLPLYGRANVDHRWKYDAEADAYTWQWGG